MKYMLLVYLDNELMDALPSNEFDESMRNCLAHADDLRQEGQLLDSQMLQPTKTARSVRVRGGRMTAIDGPYAEAKEVLAGFNLIEADSMEEAVDMAASFPWVRTGCIEVRPVQDIGAVRKQVGAAEAPAV